MSNAFASVEEALCSAYGSGANIARTDRVSGGDINAAYRLTLTDGMRVFMKANRQKDAAFFKAEASGLSAIAGTGAIRVPRVLALGTDAEHGALLLLEWIESARPARDFWETFGQRLAALHRADTAALTPGGHFGLFSWGAEHL